MTTMTMILMEAELKCFSLFYLKKIIFSLFKKLEDSNHFYKSKPWDSKTKLVLCPPCISEYLFVQGYLKHEEKKTKGKKVNP